MQIIQANQRLADNFAHYRDWDSAVVVLFDEGEQILA